jgi:hypothetical protein
MAFLKISFFCESNFFAAIHPLVAGVSLHIMGGFFLKARLSIKNGLPWTLTDNARHAETVRDKFFLVAKNIFHEIIHFH